MIFQLHEASPNNFREEEQIEYFSFCWAAVTEDRIRKWFSDVSLLIGHDSTETLKQSSERVFNIDKTCFFPDETDVVCSLKKVIRFMK